MRFRPLLALFLAAGASCAPWPPTEASTPSFSDTNTRPVLLGCPYIPPVYGGAGYRVTLRFLVLPDGSVDPNSIHWVNHHKDTKLGSYVDRAEDLARNCKYRPARLDGRPVEATVRKLFLFAR